MIQSADFIERLLYFRFNFFYCEYSFAEFTFVDLCMRNGFE